MRLTNLPIEVSKISCLQNVHRYKIDILGENPLVAADARCYMPWIASQYNMKLEKDYAERLKTVNCQEDQGDKNNADVKDEC